MDVEHRGFESYYIRVECDGENGLRFEPHCLDIAIDIGATITWFTQDPNLEFTGFKWCDESEHCAQHPLLRGNCIVGSVQTQLAAGETYWKYQVLAEVYRRGVVHHHASQSCTAMTDGLPRIHPN